MQSRFRSRHKAGFGAAGLGTAQSWFWSRHKASFGAVSRPVQYPDRFCILYRSYKTGLVPKRVNTKPAQYKILRLIVCIYIYFTYIFFIYIYTYIYNEKTYIKKIYIYIYIHTINLQYWILKMFCIDPLHITKPVQEQVQSRFWSGWFSTCSKPVQEQVQSRFWSGWFSTGTKPVQEQAQSQF